MPQTWVCRNNGELFNFPKEDSATRKKLIQEAFEAAQNPAKDEEIKNLLNNPENSQDVRLN